MRRLIQINLLLTLFAVAFAKGLPGNVIPVEYKLQIITNLGDEGDSYEFNGSVLIHIKCISPTENITLHSKNLEIDEQKTALKNLRATEKGLAISNISQDIKNDFLILELSKTLQKNHHYQVELHFRGYLGEGNVGYFRIPYLTEAGERKWLGATYFKPDNARRAFPCFDELTFKAMFTISLGRSTKFHSLSNMRLLKTEMMKDKPGWAWDHFQTTPPMPTYIVGFVISDFKQQKYVKIAEFNFNIWRKDPVRFYEQSGVRSFARALHTYESQLGMRYPFSKLDMVIVPDYPVPVMENWGLIIWQEDYFVQLSMIMFGFYSNFYGMMGDQTVRQVFGNRVTIKSWTDSWFFEGLNKYLGTMVLVPHTEEHEKRSEVTDDMISVFNFDSMRNSHAVSIAGNQLNNGTIVDVNEHRKGFLLIRMLSSIVGQKNLVRIVQRYLRIYKYKNAGSKELLELVNSTVLSQDIDVKTIMKPWLTQAGFPLITVTRDYERGTFKVKQERFFSDNELLGTDSKKWYVPLTYITESDWILRNDVSKAWLKPKEDSVTIKNRCSSREWVIFNYDASGLYMVNYDERNWHLIVDFLNNSSFKRIPTLNRVLLIESAARLAWVGRLDYKIFFDMVNYVVRDHDVQPAYVAISRIYELNILLKRRPVHESFVDYVENILKYGNWIKVIENVVVPRFRSLTGRKRYDACIYDVAACVKKYTIPQLGSAITNLVFLMTYFMNILCTGVATEEYSWSDYLESEVEDEEFKSQMLQYLSCYKNETLLQEYLDGCLNETTLRNKEIVPIITSIAKNGIGFELVTEFLSNNIQTIYDRIFPDVQELSSLIIEIAHRVITPNELAWLKNFIDTNLDYFQDIQSEVTEALRVGKLSVQWHDKNYATIETYFNQSSHN